jgi:hypothetical protein
MRVQFSLPYIGHAELWNAIIFNQNLRKRYCIAFYIKDNLWVATANSMGGTETTAIPEHCV